MIATPDFWDDDCELFDAVDYRKRETPLTQRALVASKRSLTGREKAAEKARFSGKLSKSSRAFVARSRGARYVAG